MIGFLLAAAVAAQSAPATAETEMLGTDVPSNFQIGHHQRNAEGEIIEVVEPPETVDNWSKLITLLLFKGLSGKVSAAEFYGNWRGMMRNSCPGMTDSLVAGTVDGRPAIRGALSCPHNPQTQKPENLVAVLVQGEANLMMVQVAFRHPIDAEDGALISRITGTLKVCDQRVFESCKARKATGFIPARN